MTPHPKVRRRAWRTGLGIAAMAVVVAGSACISHHAGGWEDEEPIYIAVTNHNSLDMDIYAVHEGMRTRLGMVTTSSTGHFKARSGQFGGNGDFQLYAHPIGGRSGLFSERVLAAPGNILEWSIEAVLSQSTLVVRDSS